MLAAVKDGQPWAWMLYPSHGKNSDTAKVWRCVILLPSSINPTSGIRPVFVRRPLPLDQFANIEFNRLDAVKQAGGDVLGGRYLHLFASICGIIVFSDKQRITRISTHQPGFL
jgi:hypothetical protein